MEIGMWNIWGYIMMSVTFPQWNWFVCQELITESLQTDPFVCMKLQFKGIVWKDNEHVKTRCRHNNYKDFSKKIVYAMYNTSEYQSICTLVLLSQTLYIAVCFMC